MTDLVIIAACIIALYTGAMIYKAKSIPDSISATVFHLSTGNKWVFTVVMYAVAFLLFPALLTVTAEKWQFLAFLMVAGILGVGASPLVCGERNGFHYFCAILSGVTSQLLVFVSMPRILLIWALYVGYTLWEKDCSKNLFFVEVFCMATVFTLCLYCLCLIIN